MIIANKYEVPDFCPTKCWGKERPFSQGDLCVHCPIFNCRKVEAPEEYADQDGMFCLIAAENFREDWAQVWSEWFKGGMIDYPILPL